MFDAEGNALNIADEYKQSESHFNEGKGGNLYRWGSQGWWCTGLGGCSVAGPRPEIAAARWCPGSSTFVH